METSTYMGIPREKIPWYPVIDEEFCTGCGNCLDFCSNDVFELRADGTIMNVAKPYNCVVGCDKFAKDCTTEAISFPEKAELVKMLQKLRSEYHKKSAV